MHIADNTVATHVYRIAQEAVHNAIRHGKSTVIRLSLAPLRGGWRLAIEDNGEGMPARERLRPGMGMRTMAHRAQAIGARFSLERRGKQRGSRITLELSIPARKGRP